MLAKRIMQAMTEFPEQATIVSETYGDCKFRWMVDMIWCFLRYGARPIDYVRFEFHKKSARERNRYLTIYRYFALNKKMQKQMSEYKICVNGGVKYQSISILMILSIVIG